jgi:hypothetical protein
MADLALTLARGAGDALQPATTQAMAGFVRFDNIVEAIKFAEYIAKSDLVPQAYRNKPADIVIAMQMGMELGFSALQALQTIAVINGKPGIYGDGIPALIIGQPECEDFHEQEPEGADDKQWVATCTIRRRGKSPVVRRFSYDDAKKAGLWGKSGPWSNYPKRMLQMRARGFASRDAFPDKLKGIKTVEELRDYPDDPTPAPLEPRRVGESSTVPPVVPPVPAMPPAETAPTDRAAAAPASPTAPSQGTAPSPSPSPKEETVSGVSVVNTACTPKNNVMRYDITTSAGMFYTRDQGLYDVIRQIEKTDHTATVTYKTVPAGDTRVNVLTSVVIDEPVQQGELLDGGAD